MTDKTEPLGGLAEKSNMLRATTINGIRVLDEKSSVWFWVSIALLLVFRVAYLPLSSLPLFYDEAYYHYWSENLAWGYYSKPPVVAWLIAVTTGLFGGSSELSVKLGAPVLYMLTSVVIYLSVRQLFDRRVAELSALIFVTSPIVTFNSMFITTDAPLLFFWSLAIWSFIQAIQNNRIAYWLLLGITLGLGLLSKYTMIVLLAGMLLYLLFERGQKSVFSTAGFWLAGVIALLLFMPNLYWNYQYDFISFQHTSEISKLQQSLIHPWRFLEFFIGQFVVFGPVAMWLLLRNVKKNIADPALRLLLYFTLPLLILISVQAFLAKANLNWAAPVYVAGSMLVGYALSSIDNRRLAQVAIGINLVIAAALYFYTPMQNVMGVEPTRKNTPYYRLAGWKELMQSAAGSRQKFAGMPWLSDSRKLLSYVNFYVGKFNGRPLELYGFNPDGRIKSQYELTRDLRSADLSEFLFVSESARDLSGCFKSSRLVTYLQHPVYSSGIRRLYIYHVEGFSGYGNCQNTNH
jgi:4-amino-4-deoxy-L-arabinose transferase-like glycosyltransferase